MSRIAINGIGIEYELRGEAGHPVVVLTPGGRFAKDSPGLPELADLLVAGGHQVLLWDRPNCGLSDPCFEGESETGMHADVLFQLIQKLGFTKVALAAGSAGSRVSLMLAGRYPDIVSHLAIWWVTGGTLSVVSLASYYCVAPAIVAARDGMEAMLKMPVWAEQIERNPRTREVLLSLGVEGFVKAMERWAPFYLGAKDTPVVGMGEAEFSKMKMPILIYNNSSSDLSHTRETTEWLHRLLPGSELREPPWPDDEWNVRSAYGIKHGAGHFAGWPLLAPELLEFLKT